ncbi:MAG TPA: GNAT family N-acetyltransferase [Flavobacterium sp.]|nr:GNAT family N-acetyltransferase [Flavobacterium sp.]
MIKLISSKDTFSVRHPVLRAGKPILSCSFDGDDLQTTKHFGLFINNNLIAVISIFENSSAVFNEARQFQIRGMAVLENHQKQGYGEKLIQYVEDYIAKQEGNLIWFNARERAVGFYQKLDYATIGKPLEINDAGIHYVMFKRI